MKTKRRITQKISGRLLLITAFIFAASLHGSLHADNPAGSIRVNKTSDTEYYGQVGDLITYTIVAENDGDVPLTEVIVKDNRTGDTWLFDSFPPGSVEVLITTYSITQADMDAGSVENTAKAEGVNPSGEKVEDLHLHKTLLDPDAVDGNLVVTKVSDTDSYTHAGQLITYTITVENNSNVALVNLEIKDNLTKDVWYLESMAVGDVESYIATYVISQEDMDKGSVVNTGKAEGTDPTGGKTGSLDTVIIYVDEELPGPSLLLEKTANTDTYTHAGQVIQYSITLENNSAFTVSGINLTDDLTNEDWFLSQLLPGQTQSFHTSYTITQDDVDEGSVVNIATAVGTGPQGQTVTNSDEATILLCAECLPGEITLSKIVDGPPTYHQAGDVITYLVDIENTGVVTISEIQIEDDLTGDNWFVPVLSPSERLSFTTAYVISQEDVDQGHVTNVVTAEGVNPQNEAVTDLAEKTIVAVGISSGIKVTKSASPSVFSGPGEEITYQVTVSNPGHLSLHDIDIDDDLTGDNWFIALLGPGDSESFNASYITSQADMDHGSVENTASASGFDAMGNMVQDSATRVVTATGRQADATLDLSVQPTVYANEGERIDWELRIVNTGNLTLTDVHVVEALGGNTWSETALEPGEQMFYAFSSTIGAADINREYVKNDATLSATDPDGFTLSRTDEETIHLLKIPGGLTPGTGFDEVFFVDGLQYYPSNTLKVYNRQGSLVFEAAPYQNDWDGAPNRGHILSEGDGRLPAGTYFYMLVLEPGLEPLTGYVYLIK